MSGIDDPYFVDSEEKTVGERENCFWNDPMPEDTQKLRSSSARHWWAHNQMIEHADGGRSFFLMLPLQQRSEGWRVLSPSSRQPQKVGEWAGGEQQRRRTFAQQQFWMMNGFGLSLDSVNKVGRIWMHMDWKGGIGAKESPEGIWRKQDLLWIRP